MPACGTTHPFATSLPGDVTPGIFGPTDAQYTPFAGMYSLLHRGTGPS